MKTEFTVHKIECQSCVIMIESVCEDFPGVKKAEVQSRHRKLLVEHDASMNVQKLQETLTAAGYPVSREE